MTSAKVLRSMTSPFGVTFGTLGTYSFGALAFLFNVFIHAFCALTNV
jgi:hypothetical protein